ncbi:MAG: hypothetical protein ACRCU3_07845 [Eubacteriaceae bacterium]
MNVFIVDAETNGLYGEILSIGAMVVNEKFVELDYFYGEVTRKKEEDYDPWVFNNVVPHLKNENPYKSELELLERFWEFWIKYRETSYCLADVAYPVEMGVFKKCIEVNVNERRCMGPFPLLDLSSFLMAKGYDPKINRLTLIHQEKLNQHHALDDVKKTLEIWRLLNGSKTL